MFSFSSLAVELTGLQMCFQYKDKGPVFLFLSTHDLTKAYIVQIQLLEKFRHRNSPNVIYRFPDTPVNVWLSQTGAFIYKHLQWRQPKVQGVPVRVSDGCSMKKWVRWLWVETWAVVIPWSRTPGNSSWRLSLPAPRFTRCRRVERSK